MNEVAAKPESHISTVLMSAAQLPGVRIPRESYLRAALKHHCTDEEIRRAIEATPAAAGIAVEIIDKIANESIAYETTKVTAISAAAGVPGAFAMIGTIPADMAQYFGHMLRVAQKLAYLYSWPDLFSGEGDDVDDATKGVLTLFVGVMFGAQSANMAVSRLSTMISGQVLRKLPQQALTKGVLYPLVKEVSKHLGVTMTKQVFAKSVAKAVPIIGGVVSGGLTLATFLPMSKKLQKHLSRLDLANPTGRAAVVEDLEDQLAS